MYLECQNSVSLECVSHVCPCQRVRAANVSLEWSRTAASKAFCFKITFKGQFLSLLLKALDLLTVMEDHPKMQIFLKLMVCCPKVL